MYDSIRKMQQLLRWRTATQPSMQPPKHLSTPCVRYAPDTPLVILVPGYLYTRPVMRPLAKRFSREGFTCDLLLDVVYERRTYEQQLQVIIAHLAQRRQELERVPVVVFIGHAVGGLHAYEAATWLAHTPWFKGKVIALPLGAPFRKRGNYLQDVFLRMSLVRYGATSLLQPASDRPYTSVKGVSLLCVAGNKDELVDVDRATIFRAPAALMVEADHQGLIYNKEVFGVLLRTVRSFMSESEEV